MGVRAPPRRHVHPAHRGHRRRALHPRGGEGDPRRDDLARPRLRRGPVLPDAADGPLSRGRRRHAGAGARVPLLHVAGRARGAAGRADGARREAALRRALAAGACGGGGARAPRGGRAGHPLPQPAGRHGRLGRSRQGPDRDRQRRARRPRHRPPRRHADVQLLRRRRRPRHADHARRPRRRPRQQHAAADQHHPRAGRRGARVRAPADGAGRGRAEALQAPRRRQRHAVRGDGLPARGDDQRAGAPRLGARRRRDLRPRGARRVVRPRQHQPVARALRPGEARVGEPGAPEAAAAGRARAAAPSVSRPRRARRDGGARCRRGGDAAARAGVHARRDGRRRALLLRDAASRRAGDRRAGQRRQPPGARRARRRVRDRSTGRARRSARR